MFSQPYVMEKLMELESSRATHLRPHELPARARGASGLARTVGRAMRRAGEGLEAWAGSSGGSQTHGDYSPDARRY